jgi:hypothetical protein
MNHLGRTKHSSRHEGHWVQDHVLIGIGDLPVADSVMNHELDEPDL